MFSDRGITHHTWVADAEGRAWDPTWSWGVGTRDGPAEHAVLFGVRVPPATLRAHWRTCGTATLLADTFHTYPALRVAYSAWERDLTALLENARSEHCLAEVRAGRAVVSADGTIWHPAELATELETRGTWAAGGRHFVKRHKVGVQLGRCKSGYPVASRYSAHCGGSDR